ncbi:MAG: ABC transporter substrate-binding protein [Pelotomaculum sp.]|uniref:ABC-type dipeptide transport system, periplasmic component n=1 Tax=Pelotomaculum thermopropionicum (strain DSM 13744 / JCM 10971 / SI) TaxID=370438 RepID=A5D268_PELTS|nr:ABC transporter substrate-binding protein [Pelotomaculum sp.]BAF59669.1 ABC-type dipeptide transport system, periplasmic component [Pelotomaculum thermopropionicum SI]
MFSKFQISKPPFLVLAAIILILAVSGCASQGGAGKVPGDGEIASYTIADPTGDWGFPSPYAHYARGPGYVRMSFIFDTLIWKDDKGYVPALAESWEYLKEENAYLFKLRRDATWHDGQKFKAADVAFTFDYMKKHPYQWVDTSIVKRAEAIDEYTVKLYLDKTYAPFLDFIAGTVPILPEHVWKEVENPEQFQQKEALIGTGPFKLVDYNKEQGTYLYERYEQYYQGQPKVRQLKFIKIGAEMATAALRQKQADMAQVPPEIAKELEKEGFKVLAIAHDWVAKLMINHQKDPLNNRELRQALAFAIDRQALVDTAQRGYALAGSPGLVPPDSDWYNTRLDGKYPADPARAAEILASLGYVKNGSYFEKDGRPLELELLFSGGGGGVLGSPGEREAEMIKAQLERAGIKVNLRSLESKTLDSRVNDWKFDLALSGHGGLGGDPEFLNKVIAGKGFLSARYQENEELNQMLKQQLSLMDKERRKELVAKIQEIYAEEMPCMPLYYPNWYYAHDGKVNLYSTFQGIGSGVPMPVNKMSFVK